MFTPNAELKKAEELEFSWEAEVKDYVVGGKGGDITKSPPGKYEVNRKRKSHSKGEKCQNNI